MPIQAVLYIIAANILGGISYLWSKRAVEGMPPATVTCGRSVVAVILMLGWIAWSGGWRWPFSARETLRLLLIGTLAFAAPLLLGHIGVKHSTSGNGSILILLEPLSILAFSWLLLKERIAATQVAGLVAGLAGALWIVGEQAGFRDLRNSAHTYGNLLLFLHGILWGLYTPLLKPLATRHRSMDLTLAPMLFSLLVLVPASLYESPEWKAGPKLASSLGYVVCLGVGVSFSCTILWNMGLKRLPASAIAPFVFLQPITGVLAGHFFEHEPLTWATLGGGLCIMAGVLLVILPSPRR